MDLFSTGEKLRKLAIEDADVSFLPQLPFPTDNVKIFLMLNEETIWRHEEVFVWGKRHLQPRLTAWYGNPGKSYTYSGTVMHPLPWTNLLLALRREVEEFCESQFNSVLLNLYRDQNDRMGFHSDDEPGLGLEPAIASLSYGETRTLILKHKKKLDMPSQKIKLTDGSLLLMKGLTQRCWKHGINKESRPCGPRINLTFRNIVES